MPPKQSRVLSWVFSGLAFFFLILTIVQGTRYSQQSAAMMRAEKPALTYSVWQPGKRVYRPGEQVTFTYQRQVGELPGDETNGRVNGFAIDIVVNIRTGDEFNPEQRPVLVREGEMRKRTLSRELSAKLPPGRYRLEGYTMLQTTVRTLPVEYRSREFEVVSGARRAE